MHQLLERRNLRHGPITLNFVCLKTFFFLERGDGTRDPEKTERRDRYRAALGQIGLLNTYLIL